MSGCCTITIPDSLLEVPSDLAGRYIKTLLAGVQGVTIDPPLLTEEDHKSLVAAGVVTRGTDLFSFMQSEESMRPADLVALWNSTMCGSGINEPFAKVLKLTTERATKARARLKEIPAREDWKTIMLRLKDSPWHRGENNSGWVATFDWLVRNGTTPIRILERMTCRKTVAQAMEEQDADEPSLSRL